MERERITVKDIVDEFNFEIVSCEHCLDKEITTDNLSRPGLELAGHFDYYSSERIQIFGNSETSFYSKLTDNEKERRTDNLMQNDTPCVIFSRSLDVPEEVLTHAREHEIPVLRTKTATSSLINQLHSFLNDFFAPMTSLHGVMLDVHGVGVIIKGKSSIGKSETALELIQKGHILVSDDRVDIKRKSNNLLIASSPELLKNIMEVRGIGIVNVMTMFGAGSVRDEKKLSLIVELEDWDNNKEYNRIGAELEAQDILGLDVDKIVIPVRPGRNVASIVEVAAMNYRLRKIGHNAPEEFMNKLTNFIQKKGEK
jgi:HPr kinase/phosphorylase